MSERIGTSFQNSETVDLYQHRPPYPEPLLQRIVDAAPAHHTLLDLGCGPGKTARPLAAHFDNITAIDPSSAMIRLGRSLPGGSAPNLRWVEGYAEDAPFPTNCDVVVAALSLHWMNHKTLFPKLASHVNTPHLMAVIEGDAAHDPPWEPDWQAFLAEWVPALTGKPFSEQHKTRFWDGYKDHVDVIDTQTFISAPVRQSVSDFILCQNSRDTFAPSKLGDLRTAFDRELQDLLRPHADSNGMLDFTTRSILTLCRVPAG